MTLEELQASFALMDSWEDRYGLIIDLGRQLTPLPEEAYCEANKVRGCLSQVWMTAEPEEGDHIQILGDSDAHIVKGLVAILLLIYSGKTPAEIAAVDIHALFSELGLEQHISANRRSGLVAMVERIGQLAERSA
jgi:cysteine desulfuration protein SufE